MPHSRIENITALLTGSLFCGFGIFLFNETGLLTGGTAGLSLLLTHLSDFSFGEIFFVMNLPFYWLAWQQMGWRFCLNTFAAVFSMSLIVDCAGLFITIEKIEPLFAALFGGICVGMGMLVLFRHKASLGGLGILALYLQNRHNIRAGKFQMAVDCLILASSFFIVSLPLLLLSIVGAMVLNMVIAMNHKPGRYQIT